MHSALRGIAEPHEFIPSHLVQILQYLEGKGARVSRRKHRSGWQATLNPLCPHPSFAQESRDLERLKPAGPSPLEVPLLL